MNKKTLLFDCEYNNINSEKATKLWCISAVDVNTKETFHWHPEKEGDNQYHDQFGDSFKEKVNKYEHFVGHNFWGAEAVVCKNLLGIEFKPDQVTDTLVLSRLQRPMSPYIEQFNTFKKKGWDTRLGGHSLDAWGKRLGYPKIEFDNFSEFTWKQLEYCDRDRDLNLKVYEYLLWEQKEFNFDTRSIFIEHEAHRLLVQQSINGFTLNKERARKLQDETGELTQEYINKLHEVFPPKKVEIRKITPRYTKKPKRDENNKILKNEFKETIYVNTMHGTDHNTLLANMHVDNGDGTFSLYRMEDFNPSSPKQVGERLMEIGWNPRKFTATGQPSTNKEVLGEAIDYLASKVPQVEVLRKFNIVTHRNDKAKTWLELSKEDGRVHGRVNHIGPWTHRCSHFDDNMANISRVQLDKSGKPLEGLQGNYGWDSRHCWVPKEGWVLVGADASGIQLRALAHYIGDENYIKEVISGDIHTVNQKAAGIKDRPTSKTFIYAWLLGAGDEKIGLIVGVEELEYENLFERAKNEFKWNRWRHPKNDHQRNQFDNLLYYVTDKLRSDGRIADKQTAAVILKGYFTKKQFLENLPALRKFKEEVIPQAAQQGFMVGLDGRKIWVPSEHLAMGAYLQGFEAVIMKWAMYLYQKKLREEGIPFTQVAFVHDEVQVETPLEFSTKVGETIVWAIKEAGVMLGSKCPLDGEYKVGYSWAETH